MAKVTITLSDDIDKDGDTGIRIEMKWGVDDINKVPRLELTPAQVAGLLAKHEYFGQICEEAARLYNINKKLEEVMKQNADNAH